MKNMYACACECVRMREREREIECQGRHFETLSILIVFMTCDILFLEKNNQQHNKHWLRPLNIGLFKKLILYLKYYFKYT